jgi:HAE1 family hydrophobic/amphiphilic exporter-1
VQREIRVALRPDRLLALGITAAQVNAQLRDANLNLPGGRGTLGTGEQSIRTLGSAGSVEALASRPIILPGGRTARLGDLAEVTDATAEIRTAARLDGQPVVAFEVLRTRDSSEVRVAREVAAKVAEIEAAHPGIQIRLVTSSVAFVEAGYRGAVEALLVGTALAVLVVWVFLRDWRATLVASVAMPLSLIPTFLVLHLVGYAMSNIVLLALTLVIGVLVDDAIVEIENIVRHLRAHPERGPWRAAMDASAEIGLAVMATTGAILAVFVPVMFMPGVPGQFFRQFGLTVATAVVFSLLVARVLTPLMGAWMLKASKAAHADEVGQGRVGRGYLSLLGWCLRHRWVTLGAALGFFGVSLAMIPLIPSDFIPGRRPRALGPRARAGAGLDARGDGRRGARRDRDPACPPGGCQRLRLARHGEHDGRPRHGRHDPRGRSAQREPDHHAEAARGTCPDPAGVRGGGAPGAGGDPGRTHPLRRRRHERLQGFDHAGG